jgi:hypothetical protein
MLSELVTVFQSEHQANDNFFYKIGKSAAKTVVSLSAVYGDEALGKHAVFD